MPALGQISVMLNKKSRLLSTPKILIFFFFFPQQRNWCRVLVGPRLTCNWLTWLGWCSTRETTNVLLLFLLLLLLLLQLLKFVPSPRRPTGVLLHMFFNDVFHFIQSIIPLDTMTRYSKERWHKRIHSCEISTRQSISECTFPTYFINSSSSQDCSAGQ